MAGIFTLESSLNFIFHYPKFIVRKILNFLRCVGKKTALLQAEASACVSGLANVQFCAWAVNYLVFFFCLLVANCLLCRFFTLGGNGGGCG